MGIDGLGAPTRELVEARFDRIETAPLENVFEQGDAVHAGAEAVGATAVAARST